MRNLYLKQNLKNMELIKKLLLQIRWVLLPFTIFTFLSFVEAATDEDGISVFEEEVMFWAWTLLIVNVLLFIYNKKWQNLVNKFLSR